MKKIEKTTVQLYNQELIHESTITRSYDDEKRLILEIHDSMGIESRRTKVEYIGQDIRETILIDGIAQQTSKYSRDKNLVVLKIEKFDSSNMLRYKLVNNNADHVVVEEEYDSEGNLTRKNIKHLNAEGKVEKEEEDDGKYITNYTFQNGMLSNVVVIDDGEIVMIEDHFHDDNGNEIRSLGFDREIGEEVEIHKTYEQNKIIKEVEFTNGDMNLTRKFEYDSEKTLIRVQTDFPDRKEIETIEYKVLNNK